MKALHFSVVLCCVKAVCKRLKATAFKQIPQISFSAAREDCFTVMRTKRAVPRVSFAVSVGPQMPRPVPAVSSCVPTANV